jgi:tellurium resistance protein TerD
MSDIFDTRYEGKEIELNDNLCRVGDDINITAKDPTLKSLLVGAGWDVNAFDADIPDLDVSIFLLDKNGQTRVDEDFVFYNRPQTLEGALKHNGDSRTGAGDGDDESISINLHGIPFDIVKIVFSLSIYKGEEKSQGLGMVRNGYLRLVNAENNHELMRYILDPDLAGRNETAMIVASLNREGPKWHFTPVAELVEGGLAAVATRYGLVITRQ